MEKVYRKYEKFIEKCVWDYLRKTGMSKELYDDVHSEAVIAFLDTCRKFGVKNTPIDPYVLGYARNVMRTAMKTYIWRHYNMRRQTKLRIDARRTTEFPEDICYEEDFSGPEADDITKLLTENERRLVSLRIAGMRNVDIAHVHNVDPSAVSQMLRTVRNKIKRGISV